MFFKVVMALYFILFHLVSLIVERKRDTNSYFIILMVVFYVIFFCWKFQFSPLSLVILTMLMVSAHNSNHVRFFKNIIIQQSLHFHLLIELFLNYFYFMHKLEKVKFEHFCKHTKTCSKIKKFIKITKCWISIPRTPCSMYIIIWKKEKGGKKINNFLFPN